MEKNRKVCKDCNIEKDLTDFVKDSRTKDGTRHRCMGCQRQIKREKAIIGIYKIENIEGQVYIGQSLDVRERSLNYSNMQSKLKRQRKVYESILKYGWKNHTFEVIETCSKEELNCRERYWQDFYDVLGDKGLNLTLQNCGDQKLVLSEATLEKLREASTGRIASEETRGKISQAHSGKIVSEETKQKMSKSKKELFKLKGNPNLDRTGRPHTDETKQKLREINLGRVFSEDHKRKLKENSNPRRGEDSFWYGKELPQEIKDKISDKISKTVVCLQTGIFYKSAKEASKYCDIPYSTLKGYLNGSRNNKTSLIYC